LKRVTVYAGKIRTQNNSPFGMTYLKEGKSNLQQPVQKDFSLKKK